ncbi:MAG: pilus assembly protein, partial [Proteobacteria bacterium]|nr:pilus assembly protein [Pseudomonadota bacterium]
MKKSQVQDWPVPTFDGEIRRTPRRGAHIIEMGLLLPALMFGMLWFIDVGWGFHQKTVFENAVREGARAGSIAANTDVAESIAFR